MLIVVPLLVELTLPVKLTLLIKLTPCCAVPLVELDFKSLVRGNNHKYFQFQRIVETEGEKSYKNGRKLSKDDRVKNS